MTLAAGTLLGPYEILGPLGAGGMGEVFRARDTRLNRLVAIKTLAAGIALDAESRRRFDTEARAVSSLSHPHICALYDVGRDRPRSGVETTKGPAAAPPELDFLVLELLSGESLAQRLERGPLPLDQLWQTAIEVGGALDAAHSQGITHRDLKPGNVMITKSGAKLLDFGLAKLRHAHGEGVSQATRSFVAGETAKGAVLGTFRYMAPEQVEGRDIDARADIFAFGALLYEMATGRPAFSGDTQAALTASILAREPAPPSHVRPELSPAFDHLVRRCLAKDPEDRWQSVRDVLFELKWIREHRHESPGQARRIAPALVWALASVASVTTLAAGAALLIDRAPSRAPVTPARLQLTLPAGVRLPPRDIRTNIALSPDGRYLAFAPVTQGRTQLWVRALDESTARPVPGTEDARAPFWSPDSASIGFVAGGKLMRVPARGGPVQVICDARVETLPSWGPNGSILFANQSGFDRAGIYQVAAAGGVPRQVTSVDAARDEVEHFWPSFLPDGVHFFYAVSTPAADRPGLSHTIYVGSINGGPRTRVMVVDSRFEYVPSGHVIYARDGTVLAQRFDVRTFQLSGDPIPIVDGVHQVRNTGLVEMSASANGLLVVQHSMQLSELVWVDRTGNYLGGLGSPAAYGNVRISPDGHRIAAEISGLGTSDSDLFMFDQESGIPTRFTTERGAIEPMWSPDGETVYYRSGAPPDLFQKASNGRGVPGPVASIAGVQIPQDASSDGQYLAYAQADRATDSDLWLLPLTGERTPKPYLRTAAAEMAARFSPDGRWLAFVSTESGASEVYVAPVDDAGGRYRLSAAGGLAPRWSTDGRELVYLTPDRTLVAVPLSLGAQIRRGAPKVLFKTGLLYESAGLWGNAVYEMTADGKRFLINRVLHDASTSAITVVINWTSLLP